MTLRTDTDRQSETEPSGETSLPELDLSAIAEKHKVNARKMVLDMATFDPQNLTLLEVLDMTEAAGVPAGDLTSLLGPVVTQQLTGKQARLMYALGWVIARREDPSLTFREVQTWRMEIKGKMDPAMIEANRIRAIAAVNAAAALGVSPQEALQTPIGQVTAAKARRRRR